MRGFIFISLAALLFCAPFAPVQAETVIDAHNAVFSKDPVFTTEAQVTVDHPVGPFLRDCNNDGILEADVNGDGLCEGDPEVRDYDGDGTLELPLGTPFTGNFQFTCFYIPDTVAIITTGPVSIKSSEEMAVFGSIRLAGDSSFQSTAKIDLQYSAWLAENDATISFATSLSGEIDLNPTSLPADTPLPHIEFETVCEDPCTKTGVSIRMPSDMFYTGDTCYCLAVVCNAQGKILSGYPLFVILDVYGSLFFAPRFIDFDFYDQTYPEGQSTVEVLPAFELPANSGSLNNVIFYAAFTNPEVTDLIGDWDMFTFGWSD